MGTLPGNTSAASLDLKPISLESIGLVDYRGRTWEMQDFQDDSVLIVAFLGTECPLAKLYAVRLNEIAQEYKERKVRVIAVMSNRQDSLEEIASFASRQGIEFPVLKDAGNKFADQLDAERTPEIFVFDAQRKLRYRGRVDDQYGIGYVRDEPRRKDLRIALDELLRGADVSLKRTAAVGCIIGRTKKTVDDAHVTFGGEVSKILTKRCVECHRDGEIAPFSLTDYDEVAGWSDMIAEVVRDGRMPPWHATDEHETFSNDRSLTEQEKEILYAWADAGAPAGDLSDLPPLPEKVEGWMLPREPDQVVNVSPEPFEVPAEGAVSYKYFRSDFTFEKETWLHAAELKPGNREVVHHILAFAVPKGSRKIDGARGFLVGYVPGARVEVPPKGYAKRIPAGSELIFQMHYTPVGTPQLDQSQLGLVFIEPEEVTHEIVTTSALQTKLRIPPNEANHETYASSPEFPAQATLLSMSPHMHVRGKSYRYDLEFPSGKKETILDIPAYDFNWQTTYALAKPRSIPEGSRFLCKAVFDNSEDNLNNPDPSKTVRWGDQTWEEMMIGYYHYAVPVGEEDGVPSRRERAAKIVSKRFVLGILDRNKTDSLVRKNIPARWHKGFDQWDQNGDGVLTRKEVELAP